MVGWAWLANILGGDKVMGVVKSITDKIPDANEKLQLNLTLQQLIAGLQTKILDLEKQLLASQTAIITTEAKGNFLQRSWRPVLMLCFGFILMYNYWYAPTFGTPMTELPKEFWTLLTVSVSGYVVGRSGEKIAPQVASILKKK